MASSDQRTTLWPIVTAVVAVIALLITLPDGWNIWPPQLPRPAMRLGLDLAGGTQLDFRISEDEITAREASLQADIARLKNEEGKGTEVLAKQFELRNVQEQHQNLVEAIRLVLERRINSLGVSEATITPSFFGSEKHLLVECPGVIDVNRCIATVGKTIQLEFKEEYSGSAQEYETRIRAQVDKVYSAVTSGTGSLQVYGQDLSTQLGVSFFDSRPVYLSDLPKGLEPLKTRTTKDPVFRSETTIEAAVQNASGQVENRRVRGVYLTKILQDPKAVERPLTDPPAAYAAVQTTNPGATLETKQSIPLTSAPAEFQTALQTMAIGTQKVVSMGPADSAILYLSGRADGSEEMTLSNIVIQYKGAERADPSVKRTKEEALQVVNAIRSRLSAGEDFATIARTESDGPSRKDAGSLGVIRRGTLDPAREQVAFSLKQGEISDVVETVFGYHILRADKAAAVSPPTVSFAILRGRWDGAAAQKITDQVTKGEITKPDKEIVIRGLFFSLEPTGWKDTNLNGQRFRSAAVTTDQLNTPVVQIQFDEEGAKIFQELTKRNIGKRIAIFVGGDLVSAPTVQNEIAGGNAVITGSRNFEEARNLAQDLNTGAIPAPIYLAGQTTVEATLGSNALSQSVVAAGVGLLVLCLFMILIYRLLGVLASLALMCYVVLLVAAMKLPLLLVTREHVVLTLAGIAGMILSMGMAVDANVLAFERIKEELRKGKMFKTAVDTGFRKAWPSVRDGNVSTLITCAILFLIGTSIIRGFAITLSMGILISLFTAMVVSKWLCRFVANSPLAGRPELFGVRRSEIEGGSLPT